MRSPAHSAVDHQHISKARLAEAEAIFGAVSGSSETYITLRNLFVRLHAEEPPSLQYAFNWLWGRSITIFRVENMEAPAEATASEHAGARASNRAVGGYMAGWAVHKELVRARKPGRAKPHAEKLLLRLLQRKGKPLPESDAATAYINARELFGGLSRPRPEFTTVIVNLTSLLWSNLSVSDIREHGNNAYDRAAKLVMADPSVRSKLIELLLGGEGDSSSSSGCGGGPRSPLAC